MFIYSENHLLEVPSFPIGCLNVENMCLLLVYVGKRVLNTNGQNRSSLLEQFRDHLKGRPSKSRSQQVCPYTGVGERDGETPLAAGR